MPRDARGVRLFQRDVLFHFHVTCLERCTMPHAEGNEAAQMGSHGTLRTPEKIKRNSLFIFVDFHRISHKSLTGVAVSRKR